MMYREQEQAESPMMYREQAEAKSTEVRDLAALGIVSSVRGSGYDQTFRV